MSNAKQNHLAGQSSPYLLQHVHNPVDWYPWGPEALGRAQADDKPILLSIGYAACHWCHVMERESFVDSATAALMNAHFICIKVDREERPDLDTIYMAATQAMNQGRGGWPMTVFLTPAQKPFFAGTYFPPSDQHGMPGFPRVLTHLAHLWQTDRAQLLGQADRLTQALQQSLAAPSAQTHLDSAAAMRKAAERLQSDFDPVNGGFGPAPKFPHTTSLRLLLAQAHWTKDSDVQHLVVQTLRGMAKGGMYDVIGGGFSRYSVDAHFFVPHFEKMLYDNALLAEVYAETYAQSGISAFADVASETLDFVLQELTHAKGGFFAALDADSEGVEGKFYVWTDALVHDALRGMSQEAIAAVCAYLDITKDGNWEAGQSIARAEQSVASLATRLDMPAAQLETTLKEAKQKLYQARTKRIWPGLDHKILTAWNGMMLSGLAAGARYLGQTKYLAAAERAALFLHTTMRRDDGRLYRSFGGEAPSLNAYLEDYAFVARGLVDVYEAGGDSRWLAWAAQLADVMLSDFCDMATGAFLDTAHEHEALLWRSREGHDGATPNAHATTTSVLWRLSVHLQNSAYAQAAERAVAFYAASAARTPHAYASLVLVAELMRRGAVEYAVLKPSASSSADVTSKATADKLGCAVRAHYDPAAVLAQGEAGDTASQLLADKQTKGACETLYICRDRHCEPPLTTLAQWQARGD